jgi:hypothetical protein
MNERKKERKKERKIRQKKGIIGEERNTCTVATYGLGGKVNGLLS